MVTRSPQVLADTTCASSFSNVKGHNVEPTCIGQRLSLATTSQDSSGQDAEHTLTGQRLSMATTLSELSGQDVEHIPVGQSSSLATPPHTNIFRDSQSEAPMLLDDKDDCQVQGPRGSLLANRSSTSTQKLKDDLASLKQSLSEISDVLGMPQ